MRFRDRLLDNNIFNHIADDEQASKIIERIRSRYLTRVSLPILAEIGSTEDPIKRGQMLTIAKRLSRATTTPPLDDPRTIMQRQVKSFVSGRSTVNPLISISDPAKRRIWEALKRPESLTEDQSRSLLEIKNELEEWYHEMLDTLRPRIQGLRDSRRKRIGQTLDLPGFLRHFRKSDEFLRDEVANIVSTTSFREQMEGRELDLLRSSNAWRYYFVAMGAGIYNRAFQINNFSRKRNPGGIDTVQSVYLAFTDVFVTEDIAHKQALRIVKKYSVDEKRPALLTYTELKQELGLSTAV